jgi:hypothetical protein
MAETSTPDPAKQADTRFDTAVGIILDSGLLDQDACDAFWAFIDGEIDEDDARGRIR